MKTYYEIVKRVEDQPEDGIDYKGCLYAFDTLEEAIAFADTDGTVTVISEIGGSWDEYEKCWWCEEWKPSTDFGTAPDLCEKCESYLRLREG